MSRPENRKKGILVAGWIITGIALLAIALAVEERSGLLPVGKPAPDFSATLSDGAAFRLADYRGSRPVVLFFYPGDFTMGCTQQACAFRDSYSDLRDAGAVLVGISRDTDASHRRFSAEYRLPYPLISDTGRAIIRAYGVERLGGLVGLPKRVTYVIDKEGIVRAAIHHEIVMQRHLEDVLESLRKIKEGDQD